MNLVFGVDVSKWEPRVDWATLRAQGVRFAFVRATSGMGYVDPSFKDHWEGARRAGILRGAYHYLLAAEDPIRQADLFIATVGSDKGELPPTVDFEEKYNEDQTIARIVSVGKTVLDRIEAAFGRRPMVYSRRSYLFPNVTVNGNAPGWAKDYALWVAQYPNAFSRTTMPNNNMPVQPEGWQKWKFWQYSETALIEGVTDAIGRLTECDLDWFLGTEAELYAFANIQQNDPVEHVVQAGDTFKSIADKHNVTVTELLASNPDLLQVGAKLTVPVPTIFRPVDPIRPDEDEEEEEEEELRPTRTYVVKSGDTLGAIAGRFGVSVPAIMASNPQITNPNLIFVGQVIVIP